MSQKSETTERLASAIRAIYVTAARAHIQRRTGKPSLYGAKPMPQWDGGMTPGGKRMPSVWKAIAEFCIRNELDPFRLVDVMFRGWNQDAPPYPTTFYNTKALLAYGDPHQAIVDAQRLYQTQAREFTDRYDAMVGKHPGWTPEVVTQMILRGSAFGLSALFRYVAAMELGFKDIAREFYLEALQRYMFDQRAIDASWGNVIPKELRDAAADQRAQLCMPALEATAK